MLRNAVGVGVGVGVYESAQMKVTKVYSPTLLALRGGGCVTFPEKSVT